MRRAGFKDIRTLVFLILILCSATGCSLHGKPDLRSSADIAYARLVENLMHDQIAQHKKVTEILEMIDPESDPYSSEGRHVQKPDLFLLRQKNQEIQNESNLYMTICMTVKAKLETIQPPPGYDDFHQRLIKYLEDESEFWLQVPRIVTELIQTVSTKKSHLLLETSQNRFNVAVSDLKISTSGIEFKKNSVIQDVSRLQKSFKFHWFADILRFAFGMIFFGFISYLLSQVISFLSLYLLGLIIVITQIDQPSQRQASVFLLTSKLPLIILGLVLGGNLSNFSLRMCEPFSALPRSIAAAIYLLCVPLLLNCGNRSYEFKEWKFVLIGSVVSFIWNYQAPDSVPNWINRFFF
jgi:hypothetical protein